MMRRVMAFLLFIAFWQESQNSEAWRKILGSNC
jgi:hypothetical protein